MTDHQMDHDVENDQHRAGCAECQALWAELEAIGAEARALPLLTPSRDLWSGIEARLATSDVTPLRPAARPLYRSPAFRLAIAATLLVTISSAVTWRLATERMGGGSATVAEAPAAVGLTLGAEDRASLSGDATDAYLASFTASVSQMDREIAALQAIVTERRGELDPKTVQVLETNLAVIDAAIAESRAALAADPASQFLAEQITRAYTSKLTLLRGAAELPTGL